ncbi:cyclophilin-like protein [Choiromyces venosus 120613-1]|uniref:Cyclophilin-like protein n=1 Tax=Choiromyces venosus 120613-1 TaxID=1336337 RepID=A0A3N4JAC2_9PEZI|nr:cyclophilin-like protein [Choiromyces venosus 120613-1]
MATQYNLEPQTDAKVILKTTHGDLSLELWSKQTPLTTRNFLQLCLDGYYNGTIFHRLVPGFILQGGDPTSSGHGGEAIYPGGLFADEFHPRLKFNRRGLVGMANSGRKNDNGSQFFFTLGECRELTGRNTMFGKVVGETLYNLVRIGEMETVEGSERPVYDAKIISAEVLVNPFEDMVARVKEEKKLVEGPKKKSGGKKKKAKPLLSFGGDEEGEEGPAIVKKPKFNSKLVVAAPLADEDGKVVQKENITSEASKTGDKRPITTTETFTKINSKEDGISAPTPSPSPSPPPQTIRRAPSPKLTKLQKTNAEIAAVKESLKRRTTPPLAEPKAKKKSLLSIQKSLLPSTSVQGRKRKRGKATADDDDAYATLQRFKSKLDSAPSLPTTTTATTGTTEAKTATDGNPTEVLDQDDESNLCDLHFIPNCLSCNAHIEEEDNVDGGAAGLWAHALSFEKDRLGKDLNWKKRNDEMVVIDPREKGKEILSKGKGKGKGSEWGRRRDGEGRGAGGGSASGGRGGGDWVDRGGPSGSGSGSGSGRKQ